MRVWHQISHLSALRTALHIDLLRSTRHTLLIAAMIACTGCASQSGPTLNSLEQPATAQQTRSPARYTLTEEEQELDCKVIRGRMQVALLHLKSEKKKPTSTGLSRGMQSMAAGIFGGTTYGTDPRTTAAKETARLYAYNAHLKSQDCKTFDLQKELAPSVPSQVPG